jgi:molecular chaperone DnaK (HSP70)
MKEAAAKGITQYDKILLVGGSSFMPQVKKRLEQEFPGMPIEFADPNESVAKGAAVYGNNISSFIIDDSKKGSNTSPNPKPGPQGTYLPNPIVVKNVVSKSYALQMLDESKVERLFNFIFKNSSIPLEVPVHAFTVVPNQEVVRLSVFENDYAKGASAGDIVNDEDAKLLISDDLKPLPDNLPEGAPIEVILKIDEQGLLSVDAKDVTGGRTVHMEVKLQSVMSAEEEKKAKEQVHSLRMM